MENETGSTRSAANKREEELKGREKAREGKKARERESEREVRKCERFGGCREQIHQFVNLYSLKSTAI